MSVQVSKSITSLIIWLIKLNLSRTEVSSKGTNHCFSSLHISAPLVKQMSFAASLERPQMWDILDYEEQVLESHELQRESHRLLVLSI